MNIGALWLKEKDSRKFFSGVIEYPGMRMQINVFKNTEKKGEKEPDYHIVWFPDKKDSSGKAVDQVQTAFSGQSDDIPF